MKMRCLVIDDEPLALQQMAAYVRKTPDLELAAECVSAFDAIAALQQTEIHLMFVDINMPDLNGMDLVKSLAECPLVIFTTAYSEYAVEGFKVDAIDYLLKPISYADFVKAANKARQLFDLKARGESTPGTAVGQLFVKSEYKLVRVNFADIRYIESKHEYVQIHLVNGSSVMTMVSMKAIEEQLPADRFLRVHRSFIVNLAKITVVERSRIVFDGKIYIPVGDQFKKAFQQFIEKNSLSE
jgi:two-component system, LytTR family, response regulator LytT